MIPRYGEWAKRFGRRLAVIGVHAPETERERDEGRLRRYAAEHRIEWPIVPDLDFAIWSAYGVQAWPTVVLIDASGVVRSAFVGDDSGPAIERALAALVENP